jgi:hypothetical protein
MFGTISDLTPVAFIVKQDIFVFPSPIGEGETAPEYSEAGNQGEVIANEVLQTE